jgi:hypothetical protein
VVVFAVLDAYFLTVERARQQLYEKAVDAWRGGCWTGSMPSSCQRRGRSGGVGRRAGPEVGPKLRIDRRVAAFVVVRTSMLEAQHRASTLS